MREQLWLALRNSAALRKLYNLRVFAAPMRVASGFLLPSSSRKLLRVQAGPARGLLVEVDPRWEHAVWDGSYELKNAEVFLGLVTRDAVVFDIGANFGFYAMIAARAGARVVAFEPYPDNSRNLRKHVDLNDLGDRIHIVPQAVFSGTGHIRLEIPTDVSANRNTKMCADDISPGIEVACTRLDDFVETSLQPGIIKLDVEGAESDVLRGADHIFRAFRPVLLCEVHDDANAAFAQEWLKERHYEHIWIEEGSFPKHLLAWPSGKSLACLAPREHKSH